MNANLSLFGRELARRRIALAVALVFGLVSAALLWQRGTASRSPLEVRGTGALAAALLWALALAILEGFNCLAADLRERRLAFDFRLPVHGLAIWAARVTGALVSIFGGALCFILPTALAGGDLAGGILGLEQLALEGSGIECEHPVALLVLLILAVFLALNLLGLALASRSTAAVGAVSGVVVFKLLAWAAIAPLWRATAERAAGRAILGAFALAVLGLLLASAAQVVFGRTEPDRAQRAFTAVWLVAALVGGGKLLLWSHLFLSPGPKEISLADRVVNPVTQDLVWIAGLRPQAGTPYFGMLLAPATGRVLARSSGSLPVWDAFAGEGKPSANGKLFAWIETRREGFATWSSQLKVAALEGSAIGEVREALEWRDAPQSWALSPDGRSVATAWREKSSSPVTIAIHVEEIATGRTIATTIVPGCWAGGPIYFVRDGVVRYSCGVDLAPGGGKPHWKWRELDLATRAWTVVEGTFPACRPYDVPPETCGNRKAASLPADFSGLILEPFQPELSSTPATLSQGAQREILWWDPVRKERVPLLGRF